MTVTTMTDAPNALDRLAVTRSEIRDILRPDEERDSTGPLPT